LVRRRPCIQTERRGERVASGIRQPIKPIQERRAQLMQPSKPQLHLRLNA